MVDYEKGVPAWDIGTILTIHASKAAGDPSNCHRVEVLLQTKGRPGRERLDAALAVACTCGKGDSPAERTTIEKEKRDAEARLSKAD